MKARRLKALGFALLGSLALLFAGCGQQAGGGTGGTGNGAVTSVGIQLPPPPPGGYNGVISVGVTVNEGAQVRRVVLKVDGQQVSQIDVAGLRPQGINYTLLLDTAQLDPATRQPRFRNGTRTLTVEVTDANNNTRSASTTAIFRNQDYVRGVEVSQTDNPRAPVTRGTTQWYGNGDVFVTVDIVNYSGATYSLSGSSSLFNLQASGGQGGSLSGYTVKSMGATVIATPVSGQPQLKLAKSGNGGVESSNVKFEVEDSSSTTVASKTFGLDNKAPGGTPAVQYRRIVLDYDFSGLTPTSKGTSQTLFRGTGANDGGVEGVTYQVAFQVSGNTVATATLPDKPSPGVTVSGLSNFVTYDVKVTAVEDALGNKQTLSSAAGSFQLADSSITLSNVTVDNTAPNAGTSFTVSYSATGGVGSRTYGIALKLGNKLVSIVTSTSTSITISEADFGAQYVLYAVDQAGNFAVADLPVTVSQPASDKTPPAITVSLPSSVSHSGSFSVSGTYSDANAPSTRSVEIFGSHGSLGGFEWYLTSLGSVNFTGNSYGPVTVSAPNYTGSLGVVVLGRDNFYNLGSATGAVNVQP
jgi:hypothetical protein